MTFFIANTLILFGIFALLGIAFGLVMGQGGLFSLATGAIFGVGAYTSALLTRDYGWDLTIAMVAAAGVAALVSVVLSIAALRVSDIYLVVATLAAQIVAVEVFRGSEITGGAVGLTGIPRPTFLGVEIASPVTYAVCILVIVALVGVLYRFVTRTQLGYTLRAMRENEAATLALGRDVRMAKIVVFAISSGIAAAAGALFAAHLRFISPEEFTFIRSVEVLQYTVLGGVASVGGPILGAAIAVAVPEALALLDLSNDVVGGVRLIVFAGAVLLVLMVRPQGIIPGRLRRRTTVSPLSANAASDVEDPNPLTDVSPLTCENVTVRFGGQTAVDDVSIQLEPGRVTGLVGPNGAGKTTLFNVLCGVISPDTGSVTWDGRVISRLGPDGRARLGIARSFQNVGLFLGLTVLENVFAGVRDSSRQLPTGRRGHEAAETRAMEILEEVGLADVWAMRAEQLGYAQQKMLMMARLIALDASCFLLDEPMAGMDRTTREQMIELVRNLASRGAIVCLVEHSVEVIRSACDDAIFLGAGRVLQAGSADEITRDEELIASYFGR